MPLLAENVHWFTPAKLKLPGDWKKILASDRAKMLAADIKARGQLVPVVINSDKSIRMGRHRTAACFLNGIDVAGIQRPNVSDLEQRAQTISENLHRLHMTPVDLKKELKAYVELQSEILAEKEATDDDELGWGNKKKSTKTRAIEKVAKETGKSLSTVERAVSEGPPKKGPKGEPNAAECLPEDFETFDLFLSDLEAAKAMGLIRAHKLALSAAKEAKATMGAILIAGGNTAFIQAIKGDYTAVIAQLSKALPCSLCPFCKMTEHMEKCHVCLGVGVVGKGKLTGVPPELKKRGKKAVVQTGESGIYVPAVPTK